VFGSIIVAAYKMGMVHERPRVVTRNPLDADDMTAATGATIDSSNVLEVRDRRRADEPGEVELEPRGDGARREAVRHESAGTVR